MGERRSSLSDMKGKRRSDNEQSSTQMPVDNSGLSHRQTQRLLRAGEAFDPQTRAALDHHLSGCAECRDYAVFLTQLAQVLPADAPGMELSLAERRQKAQAIQSEVHRRWFGAHFSRSLHNLAWAGLAAMLVVVVGWSVRNLRPQLLPAAPPAILSGTPESAPTAAIAALPTTAPVSSSPAAPDGVLELLPASPASPLPDSGLEWDQDEDFDLATSPPAPTSTLRTVAGASRWLSYVSSRDGYPAIYVSRTDGTGLVRLVEGLGDISGPAWSPDGTRLAFHAFSKTNAAWDIYVQNADGSGLTNLTDHRADDFEPTWSPDGRQIAFLSDRDQSGKAEIYLMNADGTRPTRLTWHAATQSRPAWSPDGRQIAFGSEKDGNPEIYVINLDGTGEKRLTNHPGGDGWPTWSPDGLQIAFTSDRDGAGDIFVMSADGSNPLNLTSGSAWDSSPAWSPDGSRIAFVRSAVGDQNGVYVMKSDGSDMAWVARSKARDSSPGWYPLDSPAVSFSRLPATEKRAGKVVAEPGDRVRAEEALFAFFNRLYAGEYVQAAELYGGSYEVLSDNNPEVEPRDHASLFRNACTINGYQCLQIKSVELQKQLAAGSYQFLVEFQNADGSLFVLGPCCGGDATQTPPQSQFTYTVRKDVEGRFAVQELPVYIP